MSMTKIDLAFAHEESNGRAKTGVDELIDDARTDFRDFIKIKKLGWQGDACSFKYDLLLRELLEDSRGKRLLVYVRASVGLLQTLCGIPSTMQIEGGLTLHQPGFVIIRARHTELNAGLRFVAGSRILHGTEQFIVKRAEKRGFQIVPNREVVELAAE